MGNVLPFIYKKRTEPMKTKKKPPNPDRPKRDENPFRRSVTLPMYLWEVIDKEADERRRSMSKQIEFILVGHYELEELSPDEERVSDDRTNHRLAS